MDIRKNQSGLTIAEKQAFVNAVLQLKHEVPSQMHLRSRYDDYVQIHIDSMQNTPGWAHGGPAFCPWHRAFLRSFELELQTIDASVTLPYWDWTVDTSTTSTTAGSPWTDGFMGGDGDPAQGGKVTSGPFRADNWVVSVSEAGISSLVRRLGQGVPTLPTPANVSACLQETPYDHAPWGKEARPSFRDRLEGWHGAGSIHNRVHLWVGGAMELMSSPNDPIFFLHHANVDRLWAEWRRLHPTEQYVPGDEVADAPQGHHLNDPMQPWGGAVTVQSVLNHHALGYQYDTEPAPPPVFSLDTMASVHKGLAHMKVRYQRSPRHHGMRGGHGGRKVPMFGLSPEDLTAGGHDLGQD